jgi:hypothetical protein
MSSKSICPYCGLNPQPLAYHEGFEDCQAAMRIFTTKMRTHLNLFSPFVTSWELKDPWTGHGEKVYKEIAEWVGSGEEFGDAQQRLIRNPAQVLLEERIAQMGK